jgi:LPXTG-motif cell wall-anchored protein
VLPSTGGGIDPAGVLVALGALAAGVALLLARRRRRRTL